MADYPYIPVDITAEELEGIKTVDAKIANVEGRLTREIREISEKTRDLTNTKEVAGIVESVYTNGDVNILSRPCNVLTEYIDSDTEVGVGAYYFNYFDCPFLLKPNTKYKVRVESYLDYGEIGDPLYIFSREDHHSVETEPLLEITSVYFDIENYEYTSFEFTTPADYPKNKWVNIGGKFDSETLVSGTYQINAVEESVAKVYSKEEIDEKIDSKADDTILQDILVDDSPEWISGGSGAYPGKHINRTIKLVSGKKYYVKINVKAEANDVVYFFLGYKVSRQMTYVDGYYECEFNGFDFDGETRLGWESEWGSITATKITISRLDSMAEVLGNIDSALDELHRYAQALVGGDS